MGKKLLTAVMFAMGLCLFAACGGGSSGTAETPAETGGGGGETGVASVDSLSSLPSVDLSQYDSSASSANIAAPVSKSLSLAKRFGEDQLQLGGTSRAGCEQNMHKQEVFRMSQMSQLDRCYPEAMERAGLITIPTGSYAYYRIIPPDMGDEQKTGMCDDIPAERVQDRERCMEESAQSGDKKTILMRLGVVDSQLQIDMCEGDPATQMNSATYGANGSLYTATVVRRGVFQGEVEGGSFNLSVDIGTSGKVEDGVITIGDNGFVSAAGTMNGKFGSGNINFERATDSSIKISGAFAGGFTDPFSGTETSFTGKTYSHVGGSPVTGCAKFSFTGAPPAMRISDMIPFNVSASDLANFLGVFGAELGITLTEANYQSVRVCPNDDFDPNNPNPLIKPMLALVDGATSCGEVTHSDTECFSVTNTTTTGDFGTETSQLFTIIADASAAYYPEVSAYDLSALLPAIGTIAFTRTWDCSGSFTDVNFASVAQATIETEMRKCFAIEEKARNNGGMGNQGQCEKGQQMDSVNNMAEGGGGEASFGAYGGEYSRTDIGNCPAQVQVPEKLFANKIDEDTYCFPMDGRCAEFSIANNEANALNIDMMGGAKVTRIVFNGNPVVGASITYLQSSQQCTESYSIGKPSFNAPPNEFGGEGGGEAPGQQGFIPRPCLDAGLTGPDDGPKCHQICSQQGVDCRP